MLGATTAVLLVVVGGTTLAAAPAGAPVQLAPPNACLAKTALGGCAGGGIFSKPAGAAMAPSGTDMYVNNQSGSVTQFFRDPATGIVTVGDDLAEDGANQTSGIAVSPDGTLVAAVGGNPSSTPDGILDIWRRNADLTLVKAYCVSEQSGVAGCNERDGIGMATGVAFAPSGPGIYVAGQYGGGDLDGDGQPDGALAVFRPGSFMGTPVLNEVQCLPAKASTVSGDKCKVPEAEPGLSGIAKVVVSPDGADVYAYSSEGVLGFSRDPATGALSGRVACLERFTPQPACSSAPQIGVGGGMAITPDGKELFVSSQGGGGLTVLTRQPASGALAVLECFTSGGGSCAKIDGLGDLNGDVTVSADGTLVFVTGGGTGQGEVRTFRRDPASGHLTPLGCVSVAGQAGCVGGSGLFWATAPMVSPDGRNVYVASYDGTAAGSSGALAEFRLAVAPTCSDAVVSVAAGGTVALPLACTDGDGDPLTRAIAGGPSSGSLGTIDQGAATVPYTAGASASGPDVVTFTGSDGVNLSAPATVTVNVTPGAPPPGPVGGSGATDKRPTSRITTKGGSVRASSLKSIKGTAADDHGVARVEVLIVRLDHGAKLATTAKAKAACKRLGSSGRLRSVKLKRGRCALAGFLRAKGTTSWSFKLSHRLPNGSYVVTSRAVDTAGHVESTFSTKAHNQLRLKVR
jgi:hypothetical protein